MHSQKNGTKEKKIMKSLIPIEIYQLKIVLCDLWHKGIIEQRNFYFFHILYLYLYEMECYLQHF